MYRERRSVIDHTVVWNSAPIDQREDHLVLPDGCMDLLWVDDDLIVAGPDTVAYQTAWTPPVTYLGLRFAAGVGPRVIGVPAREIRDRRVPLTQLWPSAQVRQLREQVAAASRPAAVLEAVALRRLADSGDPDPVDAAAFDLLAGGAGVDRVATTVGLSSRQLHRRSLDAFGYGPKTLSRILRLNRALELGREGVPAAEAAARSGYADQAHLARDTRALTGATFSALVD